MRKSMSGVAVMALMAGMAGMAGLSTPMPDMSRAMNASTNANGPTAPQEARIAQGGAIDRRTTRVRLGQGGSGFEQRRRSGPGWTNAHAQRVATKKRNVKRFHGRA